MSEFLRVFSLHASTTADRAIVATAQWTALGAVVGFLSIAIAGFAIFASLVGLRRQLSDAYYSEIDRLYFDLTSLQLTVEGLAEKCGKPASQGGDAQYEAYALMVWNFIETVFDRCCEERGIGPKKRFSLRRVFIKSSRARAEASPLFETWRPVILKDARRHLPWFTTTPDLPFKGRFRVWVTEFLSREAEARRSSAERTQELKT
jgi:hypothetical protein